MRYVPALSIAFFAGIALLAAGQTVPSYQLSAALSLVGGALLIVVAIRGLAGLAGLHQHWTPDLQAGETLLVESHNVMVRTRSWLFRTRRGPYRARLTNRRVLLSLRVMTILTRHDVTVAWLDPGRPTSVRSFTVSASEVIIQPERRFASGWHLWLPNADEWREALARERPYLLESPTST